MEYGININYFARTVGIRKAAVMIAQAGFTCLDYTPAVAKDSWTQQMQEAKAVFDSLGLKVSQTHAPFNRYGSYNGIHQTCLDRCAEATEYLGAQYMVAHGDEFDFENLTFSPEAALEYNHRYFLPYVERGEKSGYKVAFETVFEDARSVRRFTSDADELMDLIKSFHSESAVCCWDFGHAYVSFRKNSPDVIRRFGPLIQCTHLHDNTGVDAHQMPLTGDTDWQGVMDAFKAIGYSGVTSVEYSHGAIPEHMMEDYIKLTYRAAQHLWSL